MANEDQNAIVNNEEEFKKWMDAFLSSSTYDQYIEAINYLPGKFLREDSPCKNIFNINDIEEFLKIRDRIFGHPDFEQFNDLPIIKNPNNPDKPKEIRKYSPIAALNRYAEFLCRNGEPICKPLPYSYFHSKEGEFAAVDGEAEKIYQKFQDQGIYSWKTLDKLSGEDILEKMFRLSNKSEGNKSLLYVLEYDEKWNDLFGGTGKSYTVSRYGLYYGTTVNTWMAAQATGKPKPVSPEDAIKIGGEIRDALVKGAKIIEKWENRENSADIIVDYSNLFKELDDNIPGYITEQWVLKYYHMSFPSVFPIGYNEEWQNHILYSLHIMPGKDQCTRTAQIAHYIKECGISSAMFYNIVYKIFGRPRKFYRIAIGDRDFSEWHKGNYVAINWKKKVNLKGIYPKSKSEERGSRTKVKQKIKDELKDMPGGSTGAAPTFGEIDKFYNVPNERTYFLVMKGTTDYGLGKIVGGYEYKDDKEYAHCRPIKWERIFNEEDRGPAMIDERRNNTFSEINKPENILRLYLTLHEAPVTDPPEPKGDYKRNLIYFGAPGTGKSHDLNVLKEKFFTDYKGDPERDCERVTFHPDYSYAHFVGTYKPVVPDAAPSKEYSEKDPNKEEMGGEITYKYVPGPFMRVYVKAKTNPEKKFLLVIEEINRANVAAVFGDIFQLLDRTKAGDSEYPVAASEDVQGYLKSNGIKDYEKVAIPPNMYIWATMNSADQGVFPMDTAFKRRWEFKYLGIDHGEDAEDENGIKIGDKEVPLGNTGKSIGWNILRKTINELLASENINVNEDKQLGMFFINKEIIDNAMNDKKAFNETFKNKVLMYLFEDAAKHKRRELFGSKTIRYSEVCKNFEEKGLGVFVGGIDARKEVKGESKTADEPDKGNNQDHAGVPAWIKGEND